MIKLVALIDHLGGPKKAHSCMVVFGSDCAFARVGAKLFKINLARTGVLTISNKCSYVWFLKNKKYIFAKTLCLKFVWLALPCRSQFFCLFFFLQKSCSAWQFNYQHQPILSKNKNKKLGRCAYPIRFWMAASLMFQALNITLGHQCFHPDWMRKSALAQLQR